MGHILDWHNLAPCDNDKDTHGSADFGIELIPSKERASTAYMGGRCVMAYEMNHHTVSTLILNTTKHTFQFFTCSETGFLLTWDVNISVSKAHKNVQTFFL